MSPRMNRSHITCWIVALLLLAFTPVTRAQQAPPGGAGDGISVAGTGEAKGKPTAVEISATVSGDAELAADAIVKYRDTKRRAVEALEGLKLEGLKVESGGFAINQGMDAAQQQAMMQGNAVAGTGKQRVTVTEQIKVVLGGLDKLKDEELMDTVLKVVDTGRDGGLQIGNQPRNYYEMQMYYNNGRGNTSLVNFVIPDGDALRDAAYKAAMGDARKRAERLASLAGVKLGRILSVRDQGAVAMNPQAAQIYAMTGQMPDSPQQLSSGVFTEIPVRVNLAVQFEIVAGEARADAGRRDRPSFAERRKELGIKSYEERVAEIKAKAGDQDPETTAAELESAAEESMADDRRILRTAFADVQAAAAGAAADVGAAAAQAEAEVGPADEAKGEAE
jgi:uncharacterized protein YggE